MKHPLFALAFGMVSTGVVAESCDPYVDLFDPYIYGFEIMHDLNKTSAERTDIANVVAYLFQELHSAADGRKLHTMRDCTHNLFVGLGQDLPADSELAYTLGWSGVLSPNSQYGATPDSIRENVLIILDKAEKNAAASGELAPELSDAPPQQTSGISDNWRGVELSITIEGTNQTNNIDVAFINLKPDGTYLLGLNPTTTEAGQWSFDGSILSLAQLNSSAAIMSYSVSFPEGLMQWDVNKLDGQWIEKWIWQRQ